MQNQEGHKMTNITIALIKWYDDEITTYTSTKMTEAEIVGLFAKEVMNGNIKDIKFANVDI